MRCRSASGSVTPHSRVAASSRCRSRSRASARYAAPFNTKAPSGSGRLKVTGGPWSGSIRQFTVLRSADVPAGIAKTRRPAAVGWWRGARLSATMTSTCAPARSKRCTKARRSPGTTREYPSWSSAWAARRKVVAPVSICSTMSTSTVARVGGSPAWTAWTCTMSPPTNVQQSPGNSSAISMSCGHGGPQPPSGLATDHSARSVFTVALPCREVEPVVLCPPLVPWCSATRRGRVRSLRPGDDRRRMLVPLPPPVS